jgi:CRISPR system Cascade subunit CasD
MPDILTFRLYAPLAAMGGVAVGEQRDGWDRPARSAILGLIAACLGIERRDEAAHARLERDYGLALLVEHAGPTLIDYHTAQVPPARRGVRYATRAQELADRRNLGTILTRRAYRPDLVVLGAVWLREPASVSAQWALSDLKAAMERPHFTPYLGRKSCPLGLPLAPRIATAVDAVAALLTRRADHDEAAQHQGLMPRRRTEPIIALDAKDAAGYPERIRIDRRRDSPASRTRWQFMLRDEAILRLPEPPPCS